MPGSAARERRHEDVAGRRRSSSSRAVTGSKRLPLSSPRESQHARVGARSTVRCATTRKETRTARARSRSSPDTSPTSSPGRLPQSLQRPRRGSSGSARRRRDGVVRSAADAAQNDDQRQKQWPHARLEGTGVLPGAVRDAEPAEVPRTSGQARAMRTARWIRRAFIIVFDSPPLVLRTGSPGEPRRRAGKVRGLAVVARLVARSPCATHAAAR